MTFIPSSSADNVTQGDTTNLKLSLHWKNMGENWDQWRSVRIFPKDQ